MRRSLILIILISCLPVFSIPVQGQSATCGNAPPPQLISGRMARIAPGAPVRLREQGGLSAAVVAEIPGGLLVDVYTGPFCQDELNWWQVGWQGYSGWMAEGISEEYYLLPISSAIMSFDVTMATSGTAVSYEGVSFTYRGGLGNTIEADQVYAIPDNPLPYTSYESALPSPDYRRFLFVGDSMDRTPHADELLIFPAAGYAAINAAASSNIPLLRQLLQEQPAAPNDIPMLPVSYDASPLFNAAVKYIHTQHLTGVRFLTYYAMEPGPIVAEDLRYFFLGFTTDGKWLISARFWLDTSLLAADYASDPNYPNPADPNFMTLYYQYLDDSVDSLNMASPTAFSPPLTDLDAIFESLIVANN